MVDTPGKHEATIELLVPVVSRRGPRGPERSLDLDLPRAAITSLDRLELPAGVTEIRLGNRPLKPRRLENRTELLENVLAGPGPVDQLDLTWQAARAGGATNAAPVFAVSDRMTVRVHDAEILTEAEITLRVLRGEMSKWRVRMPAPGATAAELKPVSQEEDRVASIEKHLDGNFVDWDVNLKEATSESLRLILQVRQPRPKARLGIGPISVAGATTERGEIDIRATEDLRLSFEESPALNRRELTEEQRRDKVRASYAFGSLPDGGVSAPPLVSIQVEEVKGAVEAKMLHVLRLLENEKNKSSSWQLVTRVEATPLRTGVDRFEFTLPAGYQYDPSIGPMPAELVEDVGADPAGQRLAIKLAQKQVKPFAFTITGSYALPDDQARAASLGLPRPLTWGDERGNTGQRFPVLDRGGEVAVHIPEAFELFDPANGRGLEPRPTKGLGSSSLLFAPMAVRPLNAGMREYTWISERLPKDVDLNWRPYRPEMPVDAIVDISVSAGRARVRERLQFQFLQPPPPQVTLRARRGLELESVEGGRFVGEMDANGERDLILQTPVGKVHTVTLEYVASLPLPAEESERPVLIPLFQVPSATRGRTRLRIWCDADLQVSPGSKEWSSGIPEIVADRDSLPVLVLNGGLADVVPLRYQASPNPAAAALVDRILVRAAIGEDGAQFYRTRFVLQRLTDHRLELEFPVLLGRGSVVATLGGKRLPLTFLDANGREAEIGKTARLSVEPELYRQPVILDVSFQIDQARLEDPSHWQTKLRPVVLRYAVLLGRVRWQVEASGDMVPLLALDGYTREQRWGWRGWLWGPRPVAAATDLDQWLQGGIAAPAPDANDPSFVCWKSSLGEMRLLQVPARFWLLLCSLSVLLLFFVLNLVSMPGYLYGLVLALVTLMIGAIGLFWPDLLGLAAFGCEPALLILCVLLGVRWRLHHRYRQQMVFMPGFQQIKNGSSLTRKESSKIRRDLPTVEAQALKSAPVGPESQP